MKVYIVLKHWDYEDTEILGVFDNENKAFDFKNKKIEEQPPSILKPDIYVKEWEVK